MTKQGERGLGGESSVYKVVPSAVGPLHRSFRRMYEDMRRRAVQII